MNTFRPNPLLEQELKRSTILLPALEHISETIASSAQGQAPIDEGDYRDGIEGVSGMGSDGAQGRVNANDWKSGLIEFGTNDTPAFAPLRRGAEASGYRLGAIG